jgi:prepilin-type N-terminal cleavage/methylation domain-containing protein
MKKAFTLVELLVVVTIIVVLLSLLLPAMGKAIYQANLTVCGTRQKTVIGAVQSYSFDFKRYYPDRGVDDQTPGDGTNKYLNPMQVYNQMRKYDVCAPLRRYVGSMNQQMQCPLIEPIDMEQIDPDEVVESSYLFFWGWVYKTGTPEDGMFKAGDSFTATPPGTSRQGAYNILIADMDIDYHGALTEASHPDRSPQRLNPIIWDKLFAYGATFTLSRWDVPGRNRGFLDTNYGYDDGSVRRFTDVLQFVQQGPTKPDERMDNLYLEFDKANVNDLMHMPRQ